ncbi:MAG: ATP-binding protein [Nitrososphaerales archaeon]
MISEQKFLFPFTATVGLEKAKLALLSCAIDPTIGGVLLSGEKGTGKSTLVRSLSQALPEIDVVDGCPFNCNPRNPVEMCSSCRMAVQENNELKVVKRKMRVIDLPLSITVDRLVGTLDIKRALTEGIRALQPGLLAEANRNILYVDEVNLLNDYVADILLDSAALGWNIIEREGISVKHPARFVLVGSMNPEEGELRPQLLDRFGLFVPIRASKKPEERAEIVRRVEEFYNDPIGFYRKYENHEIALRHSIKRARELIHGVVLDDELLKLLTETMVKLDIRTHRAEIVTVKTAKAIAALDGRTKVRLEDLNKAMELALPHRLKSRPLELPKLPELPNPEKELPQQQPREGNRPKSDVANWVSSEQQFRSSKGIFDKDAPGEHEMLFEPVDVQVDLAAERENLYSKGSAARGSRDVKLMIMGHPHGYPITYTLPTNAEQLRDIDIVATLNAAAVREKKHPFLIRDDDFRVRVRKHHAQKLSVIILDSSGSMGFLMRTSIAKGIAKELITNSYRKRDAVALITFRGNSAEITVAPTRRYEAIIEALKALPTGGRTPPSFSNSATAVPS